MCLFSALTALPFLCLLISSAWVQDLSKKCSVGSGHEFLTTPVSNDRIQGQAVSLLAGRRRGRWDSGSSPCHGGEFAKSQEDLQNMLRSRTASHAARRIAWDGRWKEMPLGLWKVLNLFLKLTLASLCCSTQAINNRFRLLSQSWKSCVWLAQCPFVLPNLMQMECIKLVKKPKQNNTTINSRKKNLPRVQFY